MVRSQVRPIGIFARVIPLGHLGLEELRPFKVRFLDPGQDGTTILHCKGHLVPSFEAESLPDITRDRDLMLDREFPAFHAW